MDRSRITVRSSYYMLKYEFSDQKDFFFTSHTIEMIQN